MNNLACRFLGKDNERREGKKGHRGENRGLEEPNRKQGREGKRAAREGEAERWIRRINSEEGIELEKW